MRKNVQGLIAIAQSPELPEPEREAAIRNLGRFGIKSAIKPLFSLMRGENDRIRFYAMHALRYMVTERKFRPKLLELTASPNWGTRECGAFLLYHFHDRKVAKVLARLALHDPVLRVRDAAMGSTAFQPFPVTHKTLAILLVDAFPGVRSIAVCTALYLSPHKGVKVAIPGLERLLGDHSSGLPSSRRTLSEDAREALDVIRGLL